MTLDTLTIIGCTIAATIIAGAAMLWPIKTRRNTWRQDCEQWLCDRDQVHFAGLVVAVDAHSNEIVSAASDAETVRADLRRFRPERHCHLLRVPGTPSEPLRLLLDVRNGGQP